MGGFSRQKKRKLFQKPGEGRSRYREGLRGVPPRAQGHGWSPVTGGWNCRQRTTADALGARSGSGGKLDERSSQMMAAGLEMRQQTTHGSSRCVTSNQLTSG